jgi:hypothetical protein
LSEESHRGVGKKRRVLVIDDRSESSNDDATVDLAASGDDHVDAPNKGSKKLGPVKHRSVSDDQWAVKTTRVDHNPPTADVAAQPLDYAAEVLRNRRSELGPNYGVMGLDVAGILSIFPLLSVSYLIDLLASPDCVSRTSGAAITQNGRVYSTQIFYDYLLNVVSINPNLTPLVVSVNPNPTPPVVSVDPNPTLPVVSVDPNPTLPVVSVDPNPTLPVVSVDPNPTLPVVSVDPNPTPPVVSVDPNPALPVVSVGPNLTLSVVSVRVMCDTKNCDRSLCWTCFSRWADKKDPIVALRCLRCRVPYRRTTIAVGHDTALRAAEAHRSRVAVANAIDVDAFVDAGRIDGPARVVPISAMGGGGGDRSASVISGGVAVGTCVVASVAPVAVEPSSSVAVEVSGEIVADVVDGAVRSLVESRPAVVIPAADLKQHIAELEIIVARQRRENDEEDLEIAELVRQATEFNKRRAYDLQKRKKLLDRAKELKKQMAILDEIERKHAAKLEAERAVIEKEQRNRLEAERVHREEVETMEREGLRLLRERIDAEQQRAADCIGKRAGAQEFLTQLIPGMPLRGKT